MARQAPHRQRRALLRDGARTWVAGNERWLEDDDFGEVTDAFAAAGGARRTGPAGAATAQLLPVRALVDFAAPWLSAHRSR